jgi:hypothetical protein
MSDNVAGMHAQKRQKRTIVKADNRGQPGMGLPAIQYTTLGR